MDEVTDLYEGKFGYSATQDAVAKDGVVVFVTHGAGQSMAAT